MSVEKGYLANFMPGDRKKDCRFDVSSIPEATGRLVVPKVLLTASGSCARNTGEGPQDRDEMSYERRVLLGLTPRNDVPVIRPRQAAEDSFVKSVTPAEVVALYRTFGVLHPAMEVTIPTSLPPDLSDAFYDARIYLPGPDDAPIGQYS